ncbi:unnamed protein product [Sphenostylis stenocarpa]|uniref:HMA domain-containing protein n=1 Tax=Sphenostylis stenocarpa TaxID=92480 RepID=A0AA86VPE5_9FABA|nr:unnamed protein product [Sphenostylis stenocarpa]
MDAKPPQLASQPLNYQTWFLKVSIHCEGCRRKVKKVLKNIDGVFTATIDPHQHKVTVTGNVAVETLLKKLVRAGKHAEIWPENLDGEGKISGNGQKKKKGNEARELQSLEKHKGTENASAKCTSENKSSSNNLPEKASSGEQVSSEGGRSEGGRSEGGSSSAKKKKKKLQSGGGNRNSGLSSAAAAAFSGAPAHSGLQFQDLMGPVNMSPTRQQSFLYSESGYPLMVYVAAYNRFYPSYYVPSSPYTCAGLIQDCNQFQSAPSVFFEIFSDENVNGCSVM